MTMCPPCRFAVLSHILPPSPSGQAVALGRILRDLRPEYYCLISKNGSQEKRKVVPGKWSTEFVEIKEGLEEKEEVIVYEE